MGWNGAGVGLENSMAFMHVGGGFQGWADSRDKDKMLAGLLGVRWKAGGLETRGYRVGGLCRLVRSD